MDIIASYVIEKGLDGAFHILRRGFRNVINSLNEYIGKDTATSFSSVSEFWYEGVDKLGMGEGSLVSIDGVLSTYVPATPRHPRSVPGKQVEYWLKMDAPVDNFAQADFFLWSDGIVSLPPTKSNKAIVGVNDKYGFVGQGGIPVILDLNNRRLKFIYRQLSSRKPVGLEVTLTGRLIRFFPDNLKEFSFPSIVATHLPNNSMMLPAYAIEAYAIQLGRPHTILTGTVWVGNGTHDITPVYCDLFRFEDHARAIAALDDKCRHSIKTLRAQYDSTPIVPWSVPTPPLNQELQDEFRSI